MTYGEFAALCYQSPLPICHLFASKQTPECSLVGIADGKVRNLGDIIMAAIAIIVALVLVGMTHRKRAAVGRKEMNVVFIGYILILAAQIIDSGGFLDEQSKVVVIASAVHIGLIAGTFWALLINALVGYQIVEDGTFLSTWGTLISTLIVAGGTGYIAGDTAFSVTGYFNTTNPATLKNVALFTLYLVWPIIAIGLYVILETVIVVKFLGEKRPLLLLYLALVSFAIAQVFMFVVSHYICSGTNHDVDGSLFSTLFTLISVILIWMFWNSITEDEFDEFNY